MNKLIFNEGGQPVYIEDLKLLQDNNTLFTKAMMGVVLQREEACLMQPCEVVTVGINTPDLSANVEVPAGEIYYNGMLLPFEGKKLTIAKGAPLYICLKRTLTDLRTFENGQQHHCQEAWSASVETQNVGADKAFQLNNLKTYLQLMELALLNSSKRESIPCAYANDYSGDFTAKKLGNDIEFALTVSSTAKDWQKDAPGWKGMIGRIDSSTYVKVLEHKRTPSFGYEGKQYHLEIGTNGVIILYPDGVSNIYQDSVVIPVMPINIMFKLSELTAI